MLAVGIREWQTGRLILSDGRRAVSFVIVFVAQCRRERGEAGGIPDGCHQAYGKWLVKKRGERVEEVASPLILLVVECNHLVKSFLATKKKTS